MNLGLLYPRSNVHSSISMEFIAGVKACLKFYSLANEINIIAENADFGGIEKEVKGKIEKLLLIEDADVLALFIEQKVAELIKPLLKACGKLVILINAGADYPQSWEPIDNIVHLNLNHAFHCWLSGKLAGAGNDKQALMATSFYDCGYLHTAMMVQRFNLSEGKIVFNYVNNQSYKEGFHINEILGFLQSDKTTNKLLCVYDTLPASMIYPLLNKFERAAELEVFASPMMLEEAAFEKIESKLNFSVNGFIPWSASANNEANKIFCSTIVQQSGRAAGILSLMGWELALLLVKVINSGVGINQAGQIVDYLKENSIHSPRGELKLSAGENWYTAPAIKVLLNASGKKEEMIDHGLEEDWNEFVSHPPRGVVSGWTNAYLCY